MRTKNRKPLVDWIGVIACCLLALAIHAHITMRNLGDLPVDGRVPPGKELYDENYWLRSIFGLHAD